MNRYAVSDLHGQLDLYNQIKEYINDDDVVYALGDFGDRGPHPWTTLKAVLDDRQFIYLMGNHDFMLIEAISEYLKLEGRDGYVDLIGHMYSSVGKVARLCANGGIQTLDEWSREPKRMEYYLKLKYLPLEVRLGALSGKHFIYLNHAGYAPGVFEAQDVDDFVWDRHHFYDVWDNLHKHLMIHGHTPCDYLIKQLELFDKSYDMSKGYCRYSNGSKICIDRGAHYTNTTVLLNIDTLDAVEFKTKETPNEEN